MSGWGLPKMAAERAPWLPHIRRLKCRNIPVLQCYRKFYRQLEVEWLSKDRVAELGWSS